MTTRNTAILAAVTLLLGVYVIGFERGATKDLRDFRIVPIGDSASEIVALKIGSASGEIALERDPAGFWKMTAPVADRADGQKIDELLDELVRLKKIETFEEDAPSESETGLGEGAMTVAVTVASGESGTLTLGADSAIEGDIYARWDDGVPFLCWADARDIASLPHASMRDVRLLAIPPDKMRRVKIKDETEASLVIDQREPKSRWKVIKPFEVLADPGAVNKRLTVLSGMGAKDFIDDPNGDVAAAFASGAITVSIWQHGERGATTELKLATSEDGVAGFAKVSDREAVFSIDPTFLESLTLNPNDVRDRRLIYFNPKSVKTVAISAKPDRQVLLKLTNDGWLLAEGNQLVPASRQRVLDMLKGLANEHVEGFVADAVAPAGLDQWGLDNPDLIIQLLKVQQDPENPLDENGQPNILEVPVRILVSRMKPADQPAPKLFATIEGSGTVVELNPAFPNTVPVRPLAYRSAYLWPNFGPDSVRKISISRPPSAPLELEFLPATYDWTGTFAGEDITAKIDHEKASTLVSELGLPLRADSWVTNDESRAAAAFALRQPTMSLRFVLQDQTGKDFEFGLDLAPKNGDPRSPIMYGRTVGSEDIFILGRKTFDLLDVSLVKSAGE